MKYPISSKGRFSLNEKLKLIFISNTSSILYGYRPKLRLIKLCPKTNQVSNLKHLNIINVRGRQRMQYLPIRQFQSKIYLENFQHVLTLVSIEIMLHVQRLVEHGKRISKQSVGFIFTLSVKFHVSCNHNIEIINLIIL